MYIYIYVYIYIYIYTLYNTTDPYENIHIKNKVLGLFIILICKQFILIKEKMDNAKNLERKKNYVWNSLSFYSTGN